MVEKTEREELARQLLDAWRYPDGAAAAAQCLRRVPAILGDEGITALVPYVFPENDARASLLSRLRAAKRTRVVSPELQAVARSVLSELIATLKPSRLPWLEEQMRLVRYEYSEDWTCWVQLKPDDVKSIAADEHRAAELALLTMHFDGHVREAALQMLAHAPAAVAFPFVLLRANDWVEPIRRLSIELVTAFLRGPGSVSFVAHSLPLILKFREYGRARHDALRSALRAHLETAAGLEALRAELRTGGILTRRTIVRFLAESEPSLRLSFVHEALSDRDAVVRLWAARQFEAFEQAEPALARELTTRMLHDASAPLRREALYALVRSDLAAAVPQLTRALLDRNGSVRHAARYYLGEAKHPIAKDFAGFYRQSLHGHGSTEHLAAAVASLAETGTADDAQLLTPLREHASPRVVRAVLSAQARLDRVGSHMHRLSALVDERPGVSRHALLLLERRLRASDAATLQALAERVTTAHAAHALARAASKLPTWSELLALLGFALMSDARLRESASRELEKWAKDLPIYDLPVPDARTQKEIVARLGRVGTVLEAEVLSAVEGKIERYARGFT